VLHNVQCVPAATTNLVSVLAAISDGVRVVTRSTGAICKLVGPNQWDCLVKDIDGMYVLHGVSPSLFPPSLARAAVAHTVGPQWLPHDSV
jgi:hypothetical protein